MRSDFKMIFKSDLIAGSPVAYLTSLPEEAKAALTKAFVEAPVKAKAAFDRWSDGKNQGFRPTTHADYQSIVDLQRFVDQMRRNRS